MCGFVRRKKTLSFYGQGLFCFSVVGKRLEKTVAKPPCKRFGSLSKGGEPRSGGGIVPTFQTTFQQPTAYAQSMTITNPTVGQVSVCGVIFIVNYFLGTILSLPPIYIRSASGIETVPSALRLFSRNAISILGGATTVLFKVCAR